MAVWLVEEYIAATTPPAVNGWQKAKKSEKRIDRAGRGIEEGSI
jgi:hypothetical protein